MEDKENKGFDRGWEDNPKDLSDDYGLPNVNYDPLEKEENVDHLESHDRRELNSERYYDYEENKGGSKVWVFLLILLILGGIAAGVYWFQFRDAGQETVIMQDNYQLPTPVMPEVAVEEPEVVVHEEIPTPEPVKTTGSLYTISSPSSSYYIVVGSFIDDDLAKDHSDRLNSDGLDTYLIEPIGNNKFYRLAIGNYSSWGDAAGNLDELKYNFGQDIWVLKY